MSRSRWNRVMVLYSTSRPWDARLRSCRLLAVFYFFLLTAQLRLLKSVAWFSTFNSDEILQRQVAVYKCQWMCSRAHCSLTWLLRLIVKWISDETSEVMMKNDLGATSGERWCRAANEAADFPQKHRRSRCIRLNYWHHDLNFDAIFWINRTGYFIKTKIDTQIISITKYFIQC